MALLGNRTVSADLKRMRQETPWRFTLDRDVDATGSSGTGRVAWGVMFPDGACVLRWATNHTSTAVYDSLRDLKAIHGHEGATRVVWVDVPPYGPWDEPPPSPVLPTVDDLVGSDPDFTGGLEASEYVRRLRGDDPSDLDESKSHPEQRP